MGDRERTTTDLSPVFDASSTYVESLAVLDPYWATFQGVGGHEAKTPKFSPEGLGEVADLNRRTLARVSKLDTQSENDRIARDVLSNHLSVELSAYDAGDWQSDLNIIASPLQSFCDVFDLMASDTVAAWEARRDRLKALPTAIDEYRRTLTLGISNGRVVAKRQAVECARQCAVRGRRFANDLTFGRGSIPTSLLADLDQAASAAGSAYLAFGVWLSHDYRNAAREDDGVGTERYVREASKYLGMTIEPLETYFWGLEQIKEIRAHMNMMAAEVDGSLNLRQVVDLLDHDPNYAIQSPEGMIDFLQCHMNSMLETLNGTHFNIDPRARTIEQMIAPDGGAAAQCYTAPSEDWSRPGRCWYPIGDRTSFPVWGEITTANHEGVPGHHLQIAASMAASDRLSRFQRLYFSSGHGEGWALYAERLCFELDLLGKPEFVLGWLNGQLLRAVRVVIDIGMHCGEELNIGVPFDSPVAAGMPWNANTGLAYARHYLGDGFDMQSEINRYLGWPGQAISYKVGEREWLGARKDVKSALGPTFDLKRFHTVALDLGAMGLAQLRTEIVRALTSPAT